MKSISVFVLCLFPAFVFAASDESITVRSAGKLIADETINLMQQLDSSPEITLQKLSTTGSVATENAGNSVAARDSNTLQFELYDAWVDLSGDLDQDGYYHNIRVSFDADVNTQTTEAVYAKIYLSYQAGPWFHFTTTDLFEIYSNSETDSYQIISELSQGFAPGNYEVMIELYSLYHPGMVSQRIVQLDSSGYLITLEDLSYDQPAYDVDYIDSYQVSVTGSLSGPGLLLLGLLVVLRYRL